MSCGTKFLVIVGASHRPERQICSSDLLKLKKLVLTCMVITGKTVNADVTDVSNMFVASTVFKFC